MSRIILIVKALPSLFLGKAIVIADNGDRCKTFVGSGLSKDRVGALLLANLYSLNKI